MAVAQGGDGIEPVLDAATLRRLAVVVRYQFAAHRAEIDALNVFPVADADTGTNLYLTFDGALDLVLAATHGASADGSDDQPDDQPEDQPEDLLGGLARAMLLTARGNSGLLLSQVVRGLAETAARWPDEAAGITGADLAEAITAASDRAQDAVAEPAPGTMLTVLDAAADAARRAGRDGGTVGEVATAAASAARRALLATREQLPENRAAGVVDAGGAGLVIVFEALDRVLHENGARSPIWDPTPYLPSRRDWGSIAHDPGPVLVVEAAAPAPPGTPGLPGPPPMEVMYRLEGAPAVGRERLAEQLRALGDSVLVVGDEQLCTVHVHCRDAGAAIEAGLGLGRPRGISISVLDAHGRGPGDDSSQRGSDQGEQGDQRTGPERDRASRRPLLVAVFDAPTSDLSAAAAGPTGPTGPTGLTVLAHECGVRTTEPSGLEACVAATDRPVLVIPSSPASRRWCLEFVTGPAATARVRVVAADSIPQVIAVLAVTEPGASRFDSADQMLARLDAAAAGVRVAEVHRGHGRRAADRPDPLGPDDSAVAAEVATVANALLAEGGELVTVVLGEGGQGLAASIEAALADALPADAQVQVINGGQLEPLVAVGVE